MPNGVVRFCVVCSASILITVVVVFYGGLNKEVQQTVKRKISGIWQRYSNSYHEMDLP